MPWFSVGAALGTRSECAPRTGGLKIATDGIRTKLEAQWLRFLSSQANHFHAWDPREIDEGTRKGVCKSLHFVWKGWKIA
jgi:hypothetical protein